MPITGPRAAVAAAALFLVLAAHCAVARAAEVEGLYEARVPAQSKDPQAREGALGTALRQVLVKVTGRRRPESNAVVAEAIASPGRLVQQFSYEVEQPEPGADGDAEPVLWLEARFDPSVVDGVLRDAGLPVWGRIRPALLVWIAIEREGERLLLAADDAQGLGRALIRAGAKRGIPVVLPLLDLEDRSRLTPADVWAGFVDRVREASRRYRADGILVGRVDPVLPTLWEARWTLALRDDTAEWTGGGDVIELVLGEGVDEAADRLASRFAGLAAPSTTAGLDLVVSGVRTVSDYARVLGYLEELAPVSRVDVVAAEEDRISFRIDSRGGDEAVRQVISLGSTLVPEPGPDPSLRFRLLP